ncbi:ATP synthase subunit alpha [Bienertia sinuspersici]
MIVMKVIPNYIMRKKWQPTGIQISSQSGGSSKRSAPDTPTDQEDNVRPEGIKKAKRKGKEAAISTSTINFASFQSSLEDINDRRNNIGERMLEVMKEQCEEKKRQKEQEAKMRMLSMLMAKPFLDDDDKELYMKLREDFKNKFY